ncbi:MAG: formyltetrahydrofolate deformylase [Acetobacter peroxydans]|jgi:formyltetrahydrofolate deformylase|nr:formyltetrahydrofolate deformylase [Acetobacter peroxydans]
MSADIAQAAIITVKCQSRPGIIAAFSQAVVECDGDIKDINQFNDRMQDRYFMRMACTVRPEHMPLLSRRLESVAGRLGAYHHLRERQRPVRTLIMTSRFDHCLNDLLYRWRNGELPMMQPVGVVSNHPLSVACSRVHLGDIPFHHLPVTEDGRAEREEALRGIMEESGAELLVLARYMQVFSDRFVRDVEGRCINIHRSFLPGFRGQEPYRQASLRGVKLIGATAHYVTADLDEGPIIEQDIEPITHSDTIEDLVRKGRDIERRVLARAVRYHLDGRVFLNDDRTVVFPD